MSDDTVSVLRTQIKEIGTEWSEDWTNPALVCRGRLLLKIGIPVLDAIDEERSLPGFSRMANAPNPPPPGGMTYPEILGSLSSIIGVILGESVRYSCKEEYRQVAIQTLSCMFDQALRDGLDGLLTDFSGLSITSELPKLNRRQKHGQDHRKDLD